MGCPLYGVMKGGIYIVLASQQVGFDVVIGWRANKRIDDGLAFSEQKKYSKFTRSNSETFCWCDHSLRELRSDFCLAVETH